MEPIDIEPWKQLIDVNVELIKNEYFDSIKKEYYYTNNINLDNITETTVGLIIRPEQNLCFTCLIKITCTW